MVAWASFSLYSSFGSLGMFTIHKLYQAVNRCIYCDDPTGPFGDEHIIPEGIGGALVLPKASCKDCERKIGKVEGTLNNSDFEEARIQLGIKSKNSGRTRQRIKLKLAAGLDQVTHHYVPKAEHPSVFILPTFPPPGILLRQPPDGNYACDGFTVRSLGDPDHVVSRLAKIAPKNSLKDFHHVLFGRLLAKIGHAAAVAECGLGSFKPYLLDIILNGDLFGFSCYIGGGDNVPSPAHLHDVVVQVGNLDGKRLVCSNIRLFSTKEGALGYRVFVGESK
jgi:hypothetical protein